MKADCKRKAALVHVVFQLTIFMIFMKAKATAEIVEGCAFSKMNLTCNETKVINISSVVLGDSPGCPDANCCPKNSDCTAKPNDDHVNEVHRRCNGRRTCTVDVIKERIPCEWTPFYGNHSNDYERITYDCIDERKMVEGCIESQLTLSCNETKVINISSVLLGDSWCSGIYCCPTQSSCTAKPNDSQVNDVHRQCNGRQWCSVNVIKEKIPCGRTWLYNENNDFERIVYDCIDNGNISAFEDYTDEPEYTSVTGTSISEDVMTSNEPEMLKGLEPMPIIIAIVCPLVLITVIVLIIVLIKRKRKKSQLNANSNPAKLSVVSHDVDDTAYEEIETIVDRTYEKFVSSRTEDVDNHTYMAIATSGDRTYEKVCSIWN